MQPSPGAFGPPIPQDLATRKLPSFGRGCRVISAPPVQGWSGRPSDPRSPQGTGPGDDQRMPDLLPDPTAIVNTAGMVVAANASASRILGTSYPKDGTTAGLLPPDLRGPLAEVLGGASDFTPSSIEYAVCVTGDGGPRYILPRISAMRDPRGEIVGAVVALADVTECHSLDRLKSDLVATASHELKSPLTSLSLALRLVLEGSVGPVPPQQVELLRAASEDAERLMKTVDDFLDLSRIEGGRLHFDRLSVSVGELIDEVTTRFGAKARTAGVLLRTDVGPDLPAVLADRGAIVSVLNNLIENALRYTGRGGRIEISARRKSRQVELAVEDTGEGIPVEHLPHLFERFFQVPGPSRRGAAGLGLAIAREIILAHGGEIGVESRLGHGSAFFFTLPAASAHQ